MPDWTPIDYISTRGSRLRKGDLAWRERQPVKSSDPAKRTLLLLILAFGCLTFFLPLVRIDPPVLERTRWSCFQIVREAYRGRLPSPDCERCGEAAIRAVVSLPFLVSVVYALMLVALVPLSVPYASETVSSLACIGGLICLYMARRPDLGASLRKTLYGDSSVGHIAWRDLQVALLAVMAALFYVALCEVVRRRKLRDRPVETS